LYRAGGEHVVHGIVDTAGRIARDRAACFVERPVRHHSRAAAGSGRLAGANVVEVDVPPAAGHVVNRPHVHVLPHVRRRIPGDPPVGLRAGAGGPEQRGTVVGPYQCDVKIGGVIAAAHEEADAPGAAEPERR
jgi:hypothetical protein